MEISEEELEKLLEREWIKGYEKGREDREKEKSNPLLPYIGTPFTPSPYSPTPYLR